MATQYNETRVNYRIKEADGKTGETEISVKEDKVSEVMEELVTEGKGREVEVLASQTFTFHEVSETEPLTDFQTFVPDIAEQANLINRAIVLKQQQYVRRLLMAKDFTPVEGADRKSTRLNSSHSQISYAVFCLKKKKKQTDTLMYSER